MKWIQLKDLKYNSIFEHKGRTYQKKYPLKNGKIECILISEFIFPIGQKFYFSSYLYINL